MAAMDDVVDSNFSSHILYSYATKGNARTEIK